MNCEQEYFRYLRPGDRITVTGVLDAISEEKTTALGVGHFAAQALRGAALQIGDRLVRHARYPPPCPSPARGEGTPNQALPVG